MNYNGQYNMPEQTPSWSPVGQQPSPIVRTFEFIK